MVANFSRTKLLSLVACRKLANFIQSFAAEAVALLNRVSRVYTREGSLTINRDRQSYIGYTKLLVVINN